jgi:hypothetical protein
VIFTPLEIMPRCCAAESGFIIIPARFNAPLEFLTGFTSPGSSCSSFHFSVMFLKQVDPLLIFDFKEGDVREIPRKQRFAARPGLDALFRRDSGEGKGRIFRRVREVVERCGYSQREVAEYLGVHYSSVSRMLRKGND